MRRRRLMLNPHSSSDEEENERQPQQQEVEGSTSTLISSNPNPTAQIPAEHHPSEISEDDFVDVPDDFSPSPPPPPPPPPTSIPISGHPTTSSQARIDSPIDEFLENLGLKLRREWLESCTYRLNNSVPGFSSLNVAGQAELCFAEFLFSDMNFSGAGVLPQDVHSLHLVDLPGPFVLQVDEIINISCPLKERYQNASAGIKRCLKLSMTDGVQRVFGMEYRPIKDLQVLAPAGLKVAIHNVHIRRGLLVLVPEVLDVLGGLVEELDAARQRAVNEVNKPPRGRRTRMEPVPSLPSRATRAAWPSDNLNDHSNADNSTSGHRVYSGMTDQGATLRTAGVGIRGRIPEAGVGIRGRIPEAGVVPNARSNAECNPLSNAVDEIHMTDVSTPNHGNRRGRVAGAFAEPSIRPSSVSNSSWNVAPGVRSTNTGGGIDATFGTAGVNARRSTAADLSVLNARSNAEPNLSSNAVEEVNMIDANGPKGRVAEAFADPSVRSSCEPNLSWNATSPVTDTDTGGRVDGTAGVATRQNIPEDIPVLNAMSNSLPNPLSDSRRRVTKAFTDPSATPMYEPNHSWNTASDVRYTDTGGRVDATFGTGVSTRQTITEDLPFPNDRSSDKPNPSLVAVVDLDEINMIDASMHIHGDDRGRRAESFADPVFMPSAEPNPSPNTASDVKNTSMADEVEHPLTQNGDNENPFTYLASLYSKSTAKEDEDRPVVQGKIKCFITGVKEFHFKGRATFELRVFVDDGSLITEMLIDHNVVQKAIGHSPTEVTAALSSPESSVVSGMKETMRRFQSFLVNFEGIMLVKISKASPNPVALEMNQGCSSSDAWLLLRRMRMFTSPQTPPRHHSVPIVPIEISP